LLNFTQEKLASDASKKLYGFYPDVHITKEQKQNKAVQQFLRDLHFAVTESYLEGIVKYYEQGGMQWGDSQGIVWNLVPVIAFMTTDMKEAKMQKGLYQGWNCRLPCHLCLITYDDCDNTPSADDLQYRKQDDIVKNVDALSDAVRLVLLIPIVLR